MPSWSGGVSIGNLIKGYHIQFLSALEASLALPPDTVVVTLQITIDLAKGTAETTILEAQGA